MIDSMTKVLVAIREVHPLPCTDEEIQWEVGLTAHTVAKHMKTLYDTGFLDRYEYDGKLHYVLSDEETRYVERQQAA